MDVNLGIYKYDLSEYNSGKNVLSYINVLGGVIFDAMDTEEG